MPPHYNSYPETIDESLLLRQMHEQEEQINVRSKTLTDQFLLSLENNNSNSPTSSLNPEAAQEKMSQLTFDQVFLVYKFLETPLNTLVQGMKNKSLEEVKKYTRTLAKQLHPDKNCHPKSNEVF